MRIQIVLRYVGFVLLLNALGLLLSAGVSLYYREAASYILLYSALIALLSGSFPLIFVPRADGISNSEGSVIVVAGWLVSCLLGTVPYVLWGSEFNFTNAWFESVSGYTTTGATILTDIEALPKGLLFWRAVTHWLGGMGIIVFALSVIPFMGEGMKVLYHSEMSSLAVDNFDQRARESVRILAKVYIGLTALETAALMLCGIDWFDALTHAFATIATGGFSPKNASIAYYNSFAVEAVVMFFMIVSGIHFALLFAAISGRFKNLWRSPFVRYYLLAQLIGILIVTIDLRSGDYRSFSDALRYGAFQLLSVGTSTGFATADSAVWPPLSQLLLIFFSLQCACAGSTSGGIKADRIVIMAKAVRRQFQQLLHPRGVIPFTLQNRSISRDVAENSVLYIVFYLMIVLVSTALLIALGTTSLEAFSGTVAAIGNVGPGLGRVGSTGNFNHISIAGKWILSAVMLLGRLEIYALVMFFIPRQWRGQGGF